MKVDIGLTISTFRQRAGELFGSAKDSAFAGIIMLLCIPFPTNMGVDKWFSKREVVFQSPGQRPLEGYYFGSAKESLEVACPSSRVTLNTVLNWVPVANILLFAPVQSKNSISNSLALFGLEHEPGIQIPKPPIQTTT